MNIKSFDTSHRQKTRSAKIRSDHVDQCGVKELIKHRMDTVLTFKSLECAVASFEIAKKELVMLNSKTVKIAWSENKLTLPPDEDLDDSHYCRYFLRADSTKKCSHEGQTKGPLLLDQVSDYNYNENDTMDYCSNFETDDTAEINCKFTLPDSTLLCKNLHWNLSWNCGEKLQDF